MIGPPLNDPFGDSSVGQLSRDERELVWATVVGRVAGLVLDVGTWFGGGSTFFAAHAIQQLGRGRVVTIESDRHRHALAVLRYTEEKPDLLPVIEFRLGDSAKIIPTLPPVDVAICDGGDRLADAIAIDARASDGAVILFHDWDDAKESAARKWLLCAGWSPAIVRDRMAALVHAC